MTRTVIAILCALMHASSGAARPPAERAASAATPAFFITAIAERRVNRLPAERPLYWRIETLPDATAAKAREGDYALAATVEGANWLFTLAPRGGATPGATRVAEIGPIPLPEAKTYLLRVNHAGGPPGSQTSVHSHPGAEAIYVLAGEVTQRTHHGLELGKAGEALNAHAAEMAMQLKSTGSGRLSQLVMFVVDADKPFSPPAKF